MPGQQLGAAALAFDAIAGDFDNRFGAWLSVEAQRRVVRRALVDAFPAGSRLIEIGGGTGEDALWLARQGREVLMTDPSPQMVQVASGKGGPAFRTAVADAGNLGQLVERLGGEAHFDGAYSVFAGLNCVSDLSGFASNLARITRPDAPVLLVLFGTCCAGEMLVETLSGHPQNALRRFRRGDVAARLAGREFTVRYHRSRDVVRMLAPWFRLRSAEGIGVFVPPSAAEPWISAHPRLLRAFEAMDRILGRPLGFLGDHVLYRFVRTEV